MPKVVDHGARRAEIADAVWRVIRREGVPGASVRTVAAEAGWSTGAIRHYFASQGELLAFASDLLTDRVAARVVCQGTAVPMDGTATEQIPALVKFLGETLPIDAEHRAECEAWVALVQASRTDSRLRKQISAGVAEVRGVCDSTVRVIADGALDEAAVERETDLLHAAVDGLALHGVLEPTGTTPQRILAALTEYLTQLAARCGRS